ncbi:MAG: L,D-transpeptidase family protein [Rhodospirillales bacterium]
MIIRVWHPGFIQWPGGAARCALGRGGISNDKREGDGATPAGTFPLRRVFYRADRMTKPVTALPARQLRPHDGWCDASGDPAYNMLIERPFPGSHEKLWRPDSLYDVIVEIGYNDDPVRQELGSAIFMHIARENYKATEGCIALAQEDLLRLLRRCDIDTRLVIGGRPR